MTKLLNKKEVAALLGMSEGGLNKLIAMRRIPFCKITGTKHGAVRFDPAAIDDWIKANTTPAAGGGV